MDLEALSVPELLAQHQALDAQMSECLKQKHVLVDAITRKEQAAFVPGLQSLAQSVGSVGVEGLSLDKLRAILKQVQEAIGKKVN